MVYVLATDSSRINGELITAARALGEVTAVVVGSLPAGATAVSYTHLTLPTIYSV